MRAGRGVLIALLVAGLSGTMAPAAPAVETQEQRVQALKARGLREIDRRLTTLGELTTRVGRRERLTAEHETALTDMLDAQRSGLTALRTKVSADRQLATLRTDMARIVTDYRVYTLTRPKVRGVTVADVELAATERLTAIADKLDAAIDKLDDGDTKEAATNDLAGLRNKLGTTRVKIENLATTLLALQPAGYPANRPGLESAAHDLRSAGTTLREAAALARQLFNALKAA